MVARSFPEAEKARDKTLSWWPLKRSSAQAAAERERDDEERGSEERGERDETMRCERSSDVLGGCSACGCGLRDSRHLPLRASQKKT